MSAKDSLASSLGSSRAGIAPVEWFRANRSQAPATPRAGPPRCRGFWETIGRYATIPSPHQGLVEGQSRGTRHPLDGVLDRRSATKGGRLFPRVGVGGRRTGSEKSDDAGLPEVQCDRRRGKHAVSGLRRSDRPVFDNSAASVHTRRAGSVSRTVLAAAIATTPTEGTASGTEPGAGTGATNGETARSQTETETSPATATTATTSASGSRAGAGSAASPTARGPGTRARLLLSAATGAPWGVSRATRPAGRGTG